MSLPLLFVLLLLLLLLLLIIIYYYLYSACTISQHAVMLVVSAHGSIASLVRNPVLSKLLGMGVCNAAFIDALLKYFCC